VIRIVLTASVLLALTRVCYGDSAEVKIGYVQRPERVETLSLGAVPADNDGLAGAQLGIDDNNTTGKFLGQHFSLDERTLKGSDDAAAAATDLLGHGVGLLIADLSAADLLKVADAGRGHGLVVFNAGATDDALREQDCRADVVHVAPTRSMLADALAQYLVWKQWRRWLMVVGSHPKDQLFADALRRAATRFGAKIVQERVFEDTGGARRTDSGIVQLQKQIPVLTQSAPAYDILVAADESQVFADDLPYRTWDPRPVAGSAGLVATSWDADFDQWGAVQLQNRFVKRFARRMTALDFQAWSAARVIGEAAVRTKASDPGALFDYIKSPAFELAAFKGQRLTLRNWNLQLRQPILLADGRMVVSVSPQDGFLHPVTTLDTLGYDRPETKCHLQ
jgi:ABC transporter substrate binding protein (PQQ-dependent alcohol dehydrogenase system)